MKRRGRLATRRTEDGITPEAQEREQERQSTADPNGAAPSNSRCCRHFTTLFELSSTEAHTLLDRTIRLKRDGHNRQQTSALLGRTLGLLFEKPSLRTRVSFESAMARLGGSSIFLRGQDVGIGSRESAADFARVISQYVDALAVRTFSQSTIEELTRYASVPVINALSDTGHPCQAMADMVTIQEHRGTLENQKLVFVGDGNNVARSLAVASALLGLEFVLTGPTDYDFPTTFREQFSAQFPDVALAHQRDPRKAMKEADVVYTDVWASMGQESEAHHRRKVFRPYQVDHGLMARARADAIFLHCLPAHRGEEVSADVLDGPSSQVIPQAANRMHFQRALLLWLLNPETT